ncbi:MULTISPECIES: hypothetical protein [unclassified Pseudomonas]|uniref:hypothetical protein n=1 Tax=unclassified Pseudomonas TaxID=196821 RepID=UPI0015A401A4|nr:MULTISPECIES: hypothetical protein [unclassified Pseudomonas]NWC92807.1 hypothetical protein [Pseudomonas sp. IPO3779]NWD17521.1 hypothetical protein [Pseudomonas sp. IPO3778]
MDDQPFLSHMLKSISPSALNLIRREALRLKDDEVLLAELIAGLSTLVEQRAAASAEAPRIQVPDYTMLGQWSAIYCKALHRPAFVNWAASEHLQLSSLTLRHGTLQANANTNGASTLKTFVLSNDSGWWEVSAPLIDAASVIDTGNVGLPYLPELTDHHHRELPLALVLPFYGYPVPGNHFQAQVILDEIIALETLPSIDDSGRIKSTLRDKLAGEYQDHQTLLTTLENWLAEPAEAFDWLQVYSRRLVLDTGSMLSITLKSAAQLLTAVTQEAEFLSLNPIDPTFPRSYVYSLADHAIVSGELGHKVMTVPIDRSTDSALNRQWDELNRLSTLLQMDIVLDASLSLAALMSAYGYPRPITLLEVRALVDQLRQRPHPSFPYVNEVAYSVVAAGKHQKYVAVLNDRYTLQQGLHSTLPGPLNDRAFDIPLNLDPDSPFCELVNKGTRQLLDILQDPAFQEARTEHRVDTGHRVVVTASGRIIAYGAEGKPTTLAVRLKQITTGSQRGLLIGLARQSGGEVSSDGRVSLRQMLNLYKVLIPDSIDNVRVTARLLAIPALKAPTHGNYWTALQVMPLQPSQRRQILQALATFLPNPYVTLFDYLGEGIVGEKTKDTVRAEADLLLGQLLASPRAQLLATTLSHNVAWYGEHASAANTRASRSALVLAALILSVDPQAGIKRAHVLTYDLTDQYNWGLSFSEVRRVVEAMVQIKVNRSNLVPLATHLLLAGVAPEFLVRGIPEQMPYMSSHTWVHFKQYVDVLEQDTPGASRAMTFNDFISLIYLIPPARRVRRGNVPIVDWAVANGVLPKSEKARSSGETNRAIAALNEQIGLLHSTADIISAPEISLREAALQDLRKVYPNSQHLEDLIWMWTPDDRTPQPSSTDRIVIGRAFSLVELHMAGRLDRTSENWHSSNPAITWAALAQGFSQLADLPTVFGTMFDTRVAALHGAHVLATRYWLSQLTQPSREALEYGRLEFFRLYPPPLPAVVGSDTPETVGRFGTLVCCHYLGDVRFYEFFPKPMLIIPRNDLTLEALQAGTGPGFDWEAYNIGLTPTVARRAGLVAESFARLPRVYGDNPQVPCTFTSARSLEIASTLVAKQLMQGSAELSLSAKRVASLATAISGRDPWSEFLSRLVPQHIK